MVRQYIRKPLREFGLSNETPEELLNPCMKNNMDNTDYCSIHSVTTTYITSHN